MDCSLFDRETRGPAPRKVGSQNLRDAQRHAVQSDRDGLFAYAVVKKGSKRWRARTCRISVHHFRVSPIGNGATECIRIRLQKSFTNGQLRYAYQHQQQIHISKSAHANQGMYEADMCLSTIGNAWCETCHAGKGTPNRCENWLRKCVHFLDSPRVCCGE